MTSCTKHHHCFTQYWKLDRRFQTWNAEKMQEYLRDHGYFFSAAANSARLRVLCTRAARGLISYDRLNVSQLRDVCALRKVTIPPTTKPRTLAMRALLEAADDLPGQFTRFMLLPSEIRLMIYDLHTAWLCTRLDSCDNQPVRAVDWSFVAPPPIAAVARQVRQEFVSDFYRTMNFQSIVVPARLGLADAEDAPVLQDHLLRSLDCFRVLAHCSIRDVPNHDIRAYKITRWKPRLRNGMGRPCREVHRRYFDTKVNQVFGIVAEEPKVDQVDEALIEVLRGVHAEMQALDAGHLISGAEGERKVGYVGAWEGCESILSSSRWFFW